MAALIGAVLAAMAARPMPGTSGRRRSPPTPEAAAWEWGPSILLYVLPEESDYLQPTLTADRGALHLEARYNYEDRETGSAFVGWNLSFGEELKFGLAPWSGACSAGRTGIAPALTLTLEWGPLALWSQSEYVFDLGDSHRELLLLLERVQLLERGLAPGGTGACSGPAPSRRPPRSREDRSWA